MTFHAIHAIHAIHAMHDVHAVHAVHTRAPFLSYSCRALRGARAAPQPPLAHKQWPGAGVMAERLALLTTHANRSVRQQAHECQLQLVRARASLRNSLALEMCLLHQQLPWDGDVQAAATEQLLTLLRHWLACVTRERGLSDGEREAGAPSAASDVYKRQVLCHSCHSCHACHA